MIVAVDIGSGSVRAGLVTEEGVVHIAQRPGALRVVPGPLVGLDLMDLRTRVADAVDEVAAVASERRIRVDTLTCTSVRYATVWAAADAPESAAEVSWANLARADRRDVDEVQRSLGDRHIGRLGGWPTALSLSSRLATARRRSLSPPEGSVPLSVAAWVLRGWGAAAHIDEVSWADGRVAAADASWDLPVLTAGTTVGEYAGPVSAWRGARLAVCPPDTVAALHALGGLRAGDAVAIAGTTTPVVAISDEPSAQRREISDDTAWLPFGDGLRLAESNAARTGEAVRRVAALVNTPLTEDRHPVAPVGAVRSFLGPTLVPPRRLGERAASQGIEFETPLADVSGDDLLQSAIEANAWATDAHLRRVESQVGDAARAGDAGRRIVCGGQARSHRFLALLAAAGGRPVEAVTDEVTLRGAAAAASGRDIARPERTTVYPEFDVGQEPSQWASRWWERYEAPVPGERVYA